MAYVHKSVKEAQGAINESEPATGKKSTTKLTTWQAIIEKIGKEKIADFFFGAIIFIPTVLWLLKIGPIVCDRIFPRINGSNWIFFISDIIGLIAGPAVYCLFLPDVKTKKGGLGFTLLVLIAVLVHGIWWYTEKIPNTQTDSIATQTQLFKEGRYTIQVADISNWIEPDGEIKALGSFDNNFVMIDPKGNMYSPWEPDKWPKRDFIFQILANAPQRISLIIGPKKKEV